MAKILLIEDDKKLAEAIETWLSSEHHAVEIVHDGPNGYEHLRSSEYDLAIIDWNLPGMSGPDICSQYRSKSGMTPIIILTGRDAITDKVTGFDSGADDYLTKPFHMQELSSRIAAMLRRGRNIAEKILRAGDVELDPIGHRVTKRGAEVDLLPKEFALLEFLMRHRGQYYSTDALLRHVWASDSDSTADALRTCVMRLRKRIDSDDAPSLIETKLKMGYRVRPD
ncbi:MAG TPA: response regulator transcription factor [Trichormus sp.]|jgi:DNA-binding response OmpR family regulator